VQTVGRGAGQDQGVDEFTAGERSGITGGGQATSLRFDPAGDFDAVAVILAVARRGPRSDWQGPVDSPRFPASARFSRRNSKIGGTQGQIAATDPRSLLIAAGGQLLPCEQPIVPFVVGTRLAILLVACGVRRGCLQTGWGRRTRFLAHPFVAANQSTVGPGAMAPLAAWRPRSLGFHPGSGRETPHTLISTDRPAVIGYACGASARPEARSPVAHPCLFFISVCAVGLCAFSLTDMAEPESRIRLEKSLSTEARHYRRTSAGGRNAPQQGQAKTKGVSYA